MTTVEPSAGLPDLPRLLLVEDDPDLAPLLLEVLSGDYRVSLAVDGHRGLHLGLTTPFEVMVIDRGLPGIEGVDLVGRFRRSGLRMPVLLLTARGTLADRIDGLDAGAEDYLVKPFEIDELLARLRALLRRHSDSAELLPIGSYRLSVATRTVTGGPEPVALSGREAALLELLARRPGKVWTRPELLASAFDAGDGAGTVDTYVYYLRRKLGRGVVRTVHGLGYQLGAV
ncbi:MAG: response regulator transcription factor [Nakamurella sp.]